MGRNNTETIKQRLLDKCIREGDCLIFNGSINQDGYGNIQDGFGKCEKAHRLSYKLFKGEIPKGIYVLHSCDRPACCEPNHLSLGTQLDNMRDMKSKKRGFPVEKKQNLKILPEWREEITKRYLNGERQTNIAKDYNCHASAIYSAIRHLIPVGSPGFIGENHPRAKVTEEIVREIRKLHREKTSAKILSQKYNISIATIRSIISKRNWKHVLD